MFNSMRKIRSAVVALLIVSVALLPQWVGAATAYKTLGQLAPAARAATVTITNASPGVVTWTGSNFAANDQVSFATSGSLPTGLTAGTVYYVIASGLGANSFQLAATQGGAAINTSSAGSGTHTGTSYRIVYPVPASTSTVVSTITAANRSASADAFYVAIQPAAGANATKHYIAFGIALPGNDTVVMKLGFTLAATDIITVGSVNGTTSFNAFGGEIQ